VFGEFDWDVLEWLGESELCEEFDPHPRQSKRAIGTAKWKIVANDGGDFE